MSTKRSTRSAPADGSVTGVAAGNLGTATNLDETQVFDSAELKAAALEAEAAGTNDPIAEAPAAPEAARAPGATATAGSPRTEPVATSRPRPTRRAPVPASPIRPGAPRTDRRGAGLPAVAALVAVVALAVVAGAGFFSQLDFSAAEAAPAGPTASTIVEATATPLVEAKQGKGGGGHGGCHGRGHGNGCGGGGED